METQRPQAGKRVRAGRSETATLSRRRLVLWLSALSLAGLSKPLPADGIAEDDAEKAARTWLEIVDGGQYDRSWDEAAPILQHAVTREQWQQALGAHRSALGRCPSRRLVSRKLVDSLPGAPKGPYVVMQFETDFAGKQAALETITPARDADGRWRVSGYFIR